MSGEIKHSCPTLDGSDKQAVIEVLDGGMLTQGERGEQIEAWFRDQWKVDNAYAVGSGSQALAVALRSLHGGHRNKVIMPTYACNSLMAVTDSLGLESVLAESGPDYCICPESVRSLMDDDVAAIIVPHLFGIRADVEAFLKLDVPIIEDFAHALRKNNQLRGHFGICSFNATKVIAAGEGGAVLTRSQLETQRVDPIVKLPFSAVRNPLYAFSDLQAALAVNQLNKLAEFERRRLLLAQTYLHELSAVDELVFPVSVEHFDMVFRFPIVLQMQQVTVDEVIERAALVGLNIRRPVSPLMHHIFEPEREFAIADDLWRRTFSLPLYPSLTEEDAIKIAGILKQILKSINEEKDIFKHRISKNRDDGAHSFSPRK